MTIENTTPAARPATHIHVTMSRADFRTYIADVFGMRGVKHLVFKAPYQFIEYFNAPAGLIVLAHHDTIAGQVDGIHPASLSHHISGFGHIVEPFDRAGRYAVHHMSRKQQGGLVIGAFSRMIHAGEPEAPSFDRDDGYSKLEIFDGPSGPIVAVIESADVVHVIRPVSAVAEQREAA